MKDIPVHIVVLQFARDPDDTDDPINWDWERILGAHDGIYDTHFVTGGVLGSVEKDID